MKRVQRSPERSARDEAQARRGAMQCGSATAKYARVPESTLDNSK